MDFFNSSHIQKGTVDTASDDYIKYNNNLQQVLDENFGETISEFKKEIEKKINDLPVPLNYYVQRDYHERIVAYALKIISLPDMKKNDIMDIFYEEIRIYIGLYSEIWQKFMEQLIIALETNKNCYELRNQCNCHTTHHTICPTINAFIKFLQDHGYELVCVHGTCIPVQ